MNGLSANRAKELLGALPWHGDDRLRVVWIHVPDGSRGEFAVQLSVHVPPEVVIAIPLRERLFYNANAVLSDFNHLIEDNRRAFDSVPRGPEVRITVAILARDSFKLPQVASAIVIPRWFPVLPGLETFLRIRDLSLDAEVSLLSCPEARIEVISELVLTLEREIVLAVERARAVRPKEVGALLEILYEVKEKPPSIDECMRAFSEHVAAVLDARAYRISARPGNSLAGRLVRLAVRSSPDQLASVAKTLAASIGWSGTTPLKPSLLGVLLRPVNQLGPSERSWHAVVIAIYQAYQLSTAAAHAGEYASYPVGLIDTTSRDLARVISAAVLQISEVRA